MKSREEPRHGTAPAPPGPISQAATTLLPVPSTAEEESLQQLLRAVQAHSDAETDTVRSYRRLATSAADPVVALLMDLVVEDEERHHQLLRRMAARLRDALDWTASPEALPTRSARPGLEHGGDALTLFGHIRAEQESARALQELAKENALPYDGLLALLLRTMAMDSEKHADVLRFVCQRMVCRV